jgi:hypothetical protein
MFCVSVNLTSDEWIKIRDAAGQQWPKECLSCAEIVRRYTMHGIQSLKSASPDEQSRATHQPQSSMTASDTRLKH